MTPITEFANQKLYKEEVMFSEAYQKEMAENKAALIKWLESHGMKVTWSITDPDFQVREFSTRQCGEWEIARAEIKVGPYNMLHAVWEWNDANEWRHRSFSSDHFSNWEKWY